MDKTKLSYTLPTPPDGGYGWIVVLAAFGIHVVADGISYSIGILITELIDYFDIGRSRASWVGSLMVGVTYASGPIASVVTNKFGCRIVTMVGSSIVGSAFIISMFAPNIYFMYVSLGLIGGFGLSLIFLPSIITVSCYFERRRAFATGLAVCGSGIGTFVMAPLSAILLETYGWRGLLLVQAGILLNCLVFGMLLLPLKPKHVPVIDDRSENSKMSVFLAPIEAVSSPLTVQQDLALGDISAAKSISVIRLESVEHIGPLSRKDVFYTGSLANFPLYIVDPDSYKQSMLKLPTHTSPEQFGLSKCKLMIYRIFQEMDWGILTNSLFVLFAFSNFLTNLGFGVPYMFLPDNAKRLKISNNKASFLIGIIGIANTCARILFGFLADQPCVNRLLLYSISLMLCGIACILEPFCTTYELLVAYSSVYGLFTGVYVSITSVVLVDLFGLQRLTSAYGMTLMFQGLASIMGPPLAGLLYDITKNYRFSFWVAGGCILMSGVILLIIPCGWKQHLYKSRKESQYAEGPPLYIPDTFSAHTSIDINAVSSQTTKKSETISKQTPTESDTEQAM